MHWDNTIQYNLGMRARNVDNSIGNDPAHAESEYKFADRGDVVTNRLSLLSEFDAVYQDRLGFRISGSTWKDFAYDDDAETKDGYPSNYDDGKYSSYTKKYYVHGSQLLDAFVFGNFDIADRPSTLRFGRLTQYWGNALFFNSLGISYSQSASDLIKASSAPGTQAKELALPRGQINFSTQLTDELSVGMQYFLEYEPNRLPEGGTFLGPVDFLFNGPDKFAAAGGIPRHNAEKPDNINDNFGVNARWAPAWLDGTLGVYYRQFDETQPWNPILGLDSTFSPFYRVAYATDVKMFGLSLDKQIGEYSVGAEVSYRKNTALNNNSMLVDPTNLRAVKGPRGDTLNVVINSLKALERTDLYDTGNALVELGYVRKVKVTEMEDEYKGVGTAACNSSAAAVGLSKGSRRTGCSTDEAVVLATMVEPQWLQVFPGVDLSTPMFAMYGVSGNAASIGVPVYQGDVSYSLGVKGVLYQQYNLTLQYNGNHGLSTGTATSPFDGSSYTASGNNVYMLNDRNWWSLTFSSTF
ncbi:hypothetical protein Pssp01_14550 [Pseudomonas sp. NBRC 100443]|nr:hypothetical protein Pssp01_14550 [Pseudomonas sp. NBRC 100443]